MACRGLFESMRDSRLEKGDVASQAKTCHFLSGTIVSIPEVTE